MVLNWNTSVYYWTGVAALVPQVSLRGDVPECLTEIYYLSDLAGLHVLGPHPEPLL